MTSTYLIDIFFAEPVFENQIYDLFDLMDFRLISSGLNIDNFGYTAFYEDIVVSPNFFVKSEGPEDLA